MKDEMRFYDLQGTGTMSQMNETSSRRRDKDHH